MYSYISRSVSKKLSYSYSTELATAFTIALTTFSISAQAIPYKITPEKVKTVKAEFTPSMVVTDFSTQSDFAPIVSATIEEFKEVEGDKACALAKDASMCAKSSMSDFSDTTVVPFFDDGLGPAITPGLPGIQDPGQPVQPNQPQQPGNGANNGGGFPPSPNNGAGNGTNNPLNPIQQPGNGQYPNYPYNPIYGPGYGSYNNNGGYGNYGGGYGGGNYVPTGMPKFDSVMMVLNSLVAFGQSILPTLREGTPVVQISSMASMAVLPKVDGYSQNGQTMYLVPDVNSWSLPKSKRYIITLHDSLNRVAAQLEYAVSFQYGGKYQGKGQYLSGVRITPRNMNVHYGWDFNVDSSLVTVANLGSDTNSVAAAQIEITYTLKNMFGTSRVATSYMVVGDGRIYQVD